MNICINLDPGGAPSDVSSMAKSKTISIDSPFTGVVKIETLCGANWVQLPGCQFQAPGTKTIDAALQQVRVAGSPLGSPSISISGDADKAQFVTLPSNGTSVNTEALGPFNTMMVSDLSGALLKVQTSDDNVNWVDQFTFQSNGIKSLEFNACWMRVQYSGSGTPSVCVGAYSESPPSDFTDFVFIGPSNTLAAPNQFNDWEEMMAAIGGVDGAVRIVLDTAFGTAYTMPAPAVPGTPYSFSNVDIHFVRRPFDGELVLTVADGVVIDDIFTLSSLRNGTVEFDSQSGPIWTVTSNAPIFTVVGQITVRLAGSATVPWAHINNVTVPIAMGDRGSAFPTGPVEQFELEANGRLTVHSNSGRNSWGADLVRSTNAGDGRLRQRLAGAEQVTNWQFGAQSNFSGTYELENDGTTVFRHQPVPSDGSLAAAPIGVSPGHLAQYDTSGGNIAEVLPSPLAEVGSSIVIGNLVGANNVLVSVPAGVFLEGNVSVPGVNGTDTVLPGTCRTYTVGGMGLGTDAPYQNLRWVLTSIA